jgi:hypothetical protein
MKCDVCHLTATVHYTLVEHNHASESHLCELCASRNLAIAEARKHAQRLAPKPPPPPLAKTAAKSPAIPLPYQTRVSKPPSPPEPRWFATGPGRLRCAACNAELTDSTHTLDRRTKCCPACQTPCLLFTWNDTYVQIVPGSAPPAVQEFVAFAQSLPDDEPFLILLSYLKELLADLPEF